MRHRLIVSCAALSTAGAAQPDVKLAFNTILLLTFLEYDAIMIVAHHLIGL